MPWITAIAPRFRTDVQKVGRGLVGGVEIEAESPRSIEATVGRPDREKVTLVPSAESLGVDCTCSFHRRIGEPCRHIWAVLLYLDANGPPIGDPPEVIEPLLATTDRETSSTWRRLDAVRRSARSEDDGREWPAGRNIRYLLDVLPDRSIQLRLVTQRRKRDGTWGRSRLSRLPTAAIERLPHTTDREILSLLLGPADPNALPPRFKLSGDLQKMLLPRLARSGRCLLRQGSAATVGTESELIWDDQEPWRFRLSLIEDGSGYRLDGAFRRSGEELAPSDPDRVLASGFLLRGSLLSAADLGESPALLQELRDEGPLHVERHQIDRLLEELTRFPSLPSLDLPESVAWREIARPPTPGLRLRPERGPGQFEVILIFDYEGTELFAGAPGFAVFQPEGRRLLRRDPEAEESALSRLTELGIRNRSTDPRRPKLTLETDLVLDVAETLLREGWSVEQEGRRLRAAGEVSLELASHRESLSLDGKIEFGDFAADVDGVIAALRKESRFVALSDGSQGLVPESWRRRFRPLIELGARTDDGGLSFHQSQIPLIDSVLEDEKIAWDETASGLLSRIRDFDGITRLAPPADFRGTLRAYQEEGLGWLAYLDELAFGGCLADDMGLGKTVQVLAHLASRRARRGLYDPRTSLIVMPRSLIFNWRREAERFLPSLVVVEHVGSDRSRKPRQLELADLVLTTYGTMRRDIEMLREVALDYVVLDEAQAIKNPQTATARAARLLRSRRRLALSGTPVENHLGELWSLLDFLNPGLLGSSGAFARMRSGDEEDLASIARAIRPFFLRRTKEEVASDLPPRVEQVLYCEFDDRQAKRYEKLTRDWQTRVKEAFEEGNGSATILEALLRLRQAACHPGLTHTRYRNELGAKFEVLLPRLQELVDEGHKALIFSQFTSLLDLLEKRLDELELPFSRLDGKTSDRDEPVRRFQEDSDCPLMLISLRAGGLGLNLTSADYVFLLDPWWNPAVEAQAIDRAHRIGRTKQVLAYRLVTRNTLEERVLALQEEKRELASAVITEERGPTALTREDLELLLG